MLTRSLPPWFWVTATVAVGCAHQTGGDNICPRDWLKTNHPLLSDSQCHVVTFAFVSTLSPGKQEIQWKRGLELYADYTNEKQKGMRLGDTSAGGGVGYIQVFDVNVSSGEDEAAYINGYRELCKNPNATVLVMPFAAGAQVGETVIGTIRQRCPHKTILAAGGDHRIDSADPTKIVWSIYSEPSQWAALPVQFLFQRGARSFAIAGEQGATRSEAAAGVFDGVLNQVAAIPDATMLGDRNTVSYLAQAVKADPDVFIGVGTDGFFEEALEYFNANCYTPKGAFFIESSGDGPAIGPFSRTGSKWHTDGREWLATVPWLPTMPFRGPSVWQRIGRARLLQ